MKEIVGSGTSPLFAAIELLKKKDIETARNVTALGKDVVSDDDFIEGLLSFQKGIELMISGHHAEAVKPFRKAVPIISLSTNPDIIFLIKFWSNFCEGIAKLFSGDAHGAFNMLNITSDTIERVSFFFPGLDKIALSMKATATVALIRSHLNNGDSTHAELAAGQVEHIYDELIARLNEQNDDDIYFYAEIYDMKLELGCLFGQLEFIEMNYLSAMRRLDAVVSYVPKLEDMRVKLPEGSIKTVMKITLTIFTALSDICHISNNVIVNRSYLKKKEINDLRNIDMSLFEARQLANKAGDRGRQYLYTINLLSQLQERLLIIGKISKKDFGRYSGVVSFAAFVVLLLITFMIIKPEANVMPIYFMGDLMLSLVVGFGYGAIKFKPLIELLSKALETKKDKPDNFPDEDSVAD